MKSMVAYNCQVHQKTEKENNSVESVESSTTVEFCGASGRRVVKHKSGGSELGFCLRQRECYGRAWNATTRALTGRFQQETKKSGGVVVLEVVVVKVEEHEEDGP